MGIITKPSTFSSGATAIAAQVNNDFDVVYNEINGGLDNDNIKASAGIVDTKLAQITSASKVDCSALTNMSNLPTAAGSIPSLSIGVLTGSNINAGTGANMTVTMTAAGKLPAIDGSALTNLTTNSLGSWVDKSSSFDTQQATTDVLLMITNANNTETIVYTDVNNPPTTQRGRINLNTGQVVTMPCYVKKNDYWKVTGASATVFLIPLGT